nr:15087_t:CDS:10 [Entrophospora candida]
MAIQNEIEGESANKFRLYIEKVLMDLFYESTFGTLTFDWIESHLQAAKVTKSSTDTGIVKDEFSDFNIYIQFNKKGTRNRDGNDVWHMEVASPPGNQIIAHTVDDTKKTLRTDILNLVAILRNHLNIDVNIAKQIKVFSTQVIENRLTLYALSILEDGRFLSYELASADLPFDFNSRSKYKGILWMMAKFHDEMVQQMAILDKIDRLLITCKGKTLYANFKIATVGNCNTLKPSLLNFRDRAKWDAWKEKDDITKEQAMLQYIDIIEKANEFGSNPKERWTYVSTMSYEDDDDNSKEDDDDAIFKYVKQGKLNEVNEIILDQDKKTDLNKKDNQGLTLLHWACDRGHLDIVKLLIENDADINVLSVDNETPMHYEQLECARYLYKNDADLSIKDNEGLTAFEHCGNEYKNLILQT